MELTVTQSDDFDPASYQDRRRAFLASATARDLTARSDVPYRRQYPWK
jgi:hypothetical protein